MATNREKSLSPERENDQHKEPLRTRLTKHLEATKDGEWDRESCASHRSQDSLDIDADLERTSNMGGSQQDLRRFASMEDLDQEPESREPEKNDYPVTMEVTLEDCHGEPPPPHHLMGQQDGCEVEPELYTQGPPEVKIEEPRETEPEDTEDADVTVTEPPHDGECTDQSHSSNQKVDAQEGAVSPEVTKLSAGAPEEGDADTTLQECPNQTTAATNGPILSNQGIGTEEDIPANVGATSPDMTSPDVPRQGSQEPLLHLQEWSEADTGGQDSEHSRSHDDHLQEVPAGEGASVKGQEQPPPPQDGSLEQGAEAKEELSVSIEAAPYRVDEPVAVLSGNVCGYVSEKSDHQTCWKGKIVNQEGLLELEGGLGRSVRYPLLKQVVSTDPNSVQVATSSELDPGTLAVDVEETPAVPQPGDLMPSTNERPEPRVAEGPLGPSIPVVEKDGNGVVVLKQDWRVQTVNDGTAFQCDWSPSMLLKPCPMLRIPGAAMV